MIPSIETIVEDAIAGRITASQAVTWLHQHAADALYDLRDQFAGQALAAIIAKSQWERATAVEMAANFAERARGAYAYADAMLEQRGSTP